MQAKSEPNRYVQLTDSGAGRLETLRRRYRQTIEDIAADVDTPSINTVKRALRKGPVFGSTLERIWDFFQKCADENREKLPYLIEGEDFFYVEIEPSAKSTHLVGDSPTGEDAPVVAGDHKGWISRNVPRPNRLFTGRRDVLDALHSAIKGGPAALIADPQALTGLGGLGKTQTAIAYIYEHWRDYSRVFWVSSETVDDLNDGLAGIAEELGLAVPSAAGKKAALESAHNWFRTESNWLLVLDNADDVETLAPHFPHHHSGCLILTTRTRNVVKWAAPISLTCFGQHDGATLVLRRAGLLSVKDTLQGVDEETVTSASALTEELGGLPLALDQAGAYLAQTGVGIRDYLQKYQSLGIQLVDSVVDSEHASVSITFRLAVEQMALRTRCGSAAVQMIRLCAFLSPDAIPEAVFKTFAFDNPGLDPTDHYSEVCAAVCGYSLAARNAHNQTITVHRLVQKVTRDSLEEGERRTWASHAVKAVSDATPDFEFEDWSLCDLLLPQWRLCGEYIRDGGAEMETPQAAHLLYQSSRYLRARALYSEAEVNAGRAVAIAERVFGTTHAVTADYLEELACLYRELDRAEEAEPLHLRAISIVEELAGADHTLVASKLHNMALLYTHSEEYAKAEPIFLRALEIYENQPHRDLRLIATTMTQLAGAYRCTGEFGKAEPYCMRALEIYEGLSSPIHVDIATACNNLGLLYLTMERYSDASTQYGRALEINTQLRGEAHPETGTVLWGLGRVRWKQGKTREADALFRRAIQIYTTTFGASHARSARMLASYAEFCAQANGSATALRPLPAAS